MVGVPVRERMGVVVAYEDRVARVPEAVDGNRGRLRRVDPLHRPPQIEDERLKISLMNSNIPYTVLYHEEVLKKYSHGRLRLSRVPPIRRSTFEPPRIEALRRWSRMRGLVPLLRRVVFYCFDSQIENRMTKRSVCLSGLARAAAQRQGMVEPWRTRFSRIVEDYIRALGSLLRAHWSLMTPRRSGKGNDACNV